MTMSSKPHAVVIGAGVIGLTNAIQLAEAGYTVTIIAAHVPGDESIEYTSPWAGAHFRTHATAAQSELCDWDVQTFKYWEDLNEQEAQNPGAPESGVKMQISNHYWDGSITEDLWWAPHVRNFASISPLQDPIASINANQPAHAPAIKEGATSRAHSLDAPGHLHFLANKARSLGAIIFKSRLPVDGGFRKALETAEGITKVLGREGVDIFINCTGLGAIQLCNDTTMFPVRGQTVLVKGEAVATRTRYHSGTITAGELSYCIPRPGTGTTILGGTKEKGVWSSEPSTEVTKTILERCSWMAPELLTGPDGGFEVISSQVGLRPEREAGPRVEKEEVEGRKVVHCYGHAGAGFQNSVGCARKVVRLVDESLGRRDGLGISAKL